MPKVNEGVSWGAVMVLEAMWRINSPKWPGWWLHFHASAFMRYSLVPNLPQNVTSQWRKSSLWMRSLVCFLIALWRVLCIVYVFLNFSFKQKVECACDCSLVHMFKGPYTTWISSHSCWIQVAGGPFDTKLKELGGILLAEQWLYPIGFVHCLGVQVLWLSGCNSQQGIFLYSLWAYFISPSLETCIYCMYNLIYFIYS